MYMYVKNKLIYGAKHMEFSKGQKLKNNLVRLSRDTNTVILRKQNLFFILVKTSKKTKSLS